MSFQEALSKLKTAHQLQLPFFNLFGKELVNCDWSEESVTAETEDGQYTLKIDYSDILINCGIYYYGGKGVVGKENHKKDLRFSSGTVDSSRKLHETTKPYLKLASFEIPNVKY